MRKQNIAAMQIDLMNADGHILYGKLPQKLCNNVKYKRMLFMIGFMFYNFDCDIDLDWRYTMNESNYKQITGVINDMVHFNEQTLMQFVEVKKANFSIVDKTNLIDLIIYKNVIEYNQEDQLLTLRVVELVDSIHDYNEFIETLNILLIQHKEKYWKDCKRTKQAYFSQDNKPLEP